MSKSASEAKIRELNRQIRVLEDKLNRREKELQREVSRWQWLARPKILDLMGVYPPLRKLLNVLAEAADLQDPASGAPIEDTMRTEYTANGPRASTSQTERGVLTHRRARANVTLISRELEHLRSSFTKDLEHRTHRFAQLVGASEHEYDLPDPPVCWRKGCRKRGAQQPYSAWWDGCAGCGRRFETERTGT